MKVSVIVPVYNVEDVLHYCIDSILKQTYNSFELILVDDGSTDESGEICDKYASVNNNVSVIHIKNEGVSKARNTGIQNAKGDYICFVDSDDYISENYLEELIKTKNAFHEYDNIWCGFQTVDGYDTPSVLQKIIFSDDSTVSKSSIKQIMTLHEKWLDSGPVCKLYCLKIIKDNDLKFPEDISLGEDLIFNFHYLDCTNGKILVINSCLYNYVKISNNSLGSKYYEDMFDIYKRINSVMYDCIIKWECDETEVIKYHNTCFYKFEVVLRNTFSTQSTIKRKNKYNKKIMKSQDFKTALNNSDCFIHPLYRFAYKLCSYKLVRILDSISTKRSN